MFVEDLGNARVFKPVSKAQPLGPPGRSSTNPAAMAAPARNALARDMPIRIRDRALLFLPGRRRQQDVRERGGIGLRYTIGHHDEDHNGAALSRPRSAFGRLTAGLVPMIQTAFICPRCIASNRSTALRPPLRNSRRRPKIPHDAPMLRILQFHVGSQRIGEPAHLAPTHGFGAGR